VNDEPHQSGEYAMALEACVDRLLNGFTPRKYDGEWWWVPPGWMGRGYASMTTAEAAAMEVRVPKAAVRHATAGASTTTPEGGGS
jgi:hypothetical protein